MKKDFVSSIFGKIVITLFLLMILALVPPTIINLNVLVGLAYRDAAQAYLENNFGIVSTAEGKYSGDFEVDGDLVVAGNITGPTGRTATTIIAAKNAPAIWRAQADVVCDGIADNIEIQAAIDSQYSNNGSADIQLSPGTFDIKADVDGRNRLKLKGVGVPDQGGDIGENINATIWEWTGAADGKMLSLWDSSNPIRSVYVSNILFDLNDSAGSGVYARDIDGSILEKLGFRNVKTSANAITLVSWATDIHNLMVRDVTAYNPVAGHAANAIWMKGYNAVQITNCDFENIEVVGGYNAAFYISYQVNRSTFRHIDAITAGAIQIDGDTETFGLVFDFVRGDAAQGISLTNTDRLQMVNVGSNLTVSIVSGVTQYRIEKSDGTIYSDLSGSGSSVGTGAQQTVAHGLGFTPVKAQIGVWTDNTTAAFLAAQTANPDVTNLYITSDNNSAWHWATVGR